MNRSDEVYDLVASNLKYYRKKAGLSQLALATTCNMSTSYIGEVETRKKAISLHKLKAISEALNQPIYLFFMSSQEQTFNDRSKLLEYLERDLKDKISLLIEKEIASFR
jgi:transcriptional regulator with XRE-family HTH domain